ncbi:MAG: hypothetical protein R3F40_05105 [Candidatus Competibacteraceae bacterium]
MRKLMKIVVALLIILILIAGGVGGYLWYDTKQHVDQFVMMTKPFAEISYGGIEVSPAGSLGVTRLRISPNMNDVITIGAIRMHAPTFCPAENPLAVEPGRTTRRAVACSANSSFPCTAAFSARRRRLPNRVARLKIWMPWGAGRSRILAAPSGRRWVTIISSATSKLVTTSMPLATYWRFG